MTANEALVKHLDSLFDVNPAEARRVVRCIKDRCGISSPVFSNWRRGVTLIRKLQRNEITQILGINIFENVTD